MYALRMASAWVARAPRTSGMNVSSSCSSLRILRDRRLRCSGWMGASRLLCDSVRRDEMSGGAAARSDRGRARSRERSAPTRNTSESESVPTSTSESLNEPERDCCSSARRMKSSSSRSSTSMMSGEAERARAPWETGASSGRGGVGRSFTSSTSTGGVGGSSSPPSCMRAEADGGQAPEGACSPPSRARPRA